MLELTVEEAFHGTSRTVTVTAQDSSDTVQVRIPPGVVTGQRIEVPLPCRPDGRRPPPVFLRVQLLPRERHHVEG